jgi:hypothetical protein
VKVEGGKVKIERSHSLPIVSLRQGPIYDLRKSEKARIRHRLTDCTPSNKKKSRFAPKNVPTFNF